MTKGSFMFKVLTTGDGGVGKTTLLYRYVNGIFLEDTKITIGVEFFLKRVILNETNIILQLWDFGGQDRFQFMHNHYTEGAKGAILMYDLTRPITLDNLDYWVNLCRKDNPNIPIIFIGGKSDVVNTVIIKENTIENLIKKYSFCDYLEISSKTGENVEKVFEILAENLILALNNSLSLPG